MPDPIRSPSSNVWVTVEQNSTPATITTHPRAIRRTEVRLGKDEPLAVALQRICLEQLDRASIALAERDLDDGIHTARKAMKRIRGILRLSRDEVGERVYKTENVILRDAGRRLAPLRDSVVAVQTLDVLASRYEGHLVADTVANMRSRLVAAHSTEHERVRQAGSLIEVAAVIDTARARFADWPTGSADPWGRSPIRNSFAAIAPGIRRTYRRGRRAMARAGNGGSVADYHEWRKRAKYLRYQLETLAPIWPQALVGLARTIDDLGETLGTEHDLALLSEKLGADSFRGDSAARELLAALAARERVNLRTAATPLGQKVYAERPDRFVERLGSYWRAWRPT